MCTDDVTHLHWNKRWRGRRKYKPFPLFPYHLLELPVSVLELPVSCFLSSGMYSRLHRFQRRSINLWKYLALLVTVSWVLGCLLHFWLYLAVTATVFHWSNGMVSKAPPDRLDTDRLMAWSSVCIQLQLELSRAPHMSGEPFQVFSSDNVWYSWSFFQKKPPHHGTFSRLNFHWIFFSKRKDITSGSLKIFVSWVAAALNVFALSSMISSGIPLRATNLRRHRMNAWPWVVRLGVSSVCMAIVLPQVKRQMYTLVTCSSFPKTVFTKSDPAKSTPVLAKGYPSLNLNSGVSYDLPFSLLHTTQL